MSRIRKRAETTFNTKWRKVVQYAIEKPRESSFVRRLGSPLRVPAGAGQP